MRRVARILKLVVFAVALAILSDSGSGPYAQQWTGYQCVTFYKETLECPACCTESSNYFENSITALQSGYGIESAFISNYSCGSKEPGCYAECSGEYEEAVRDFPACCSEVGFYCDTNLPCCDSLCQNHHCCVQRNHRCDDDSECCSGVCDIWCC
jgi:hypothetical protein